MSKINVYSLCILVTAYCCLVNPSAQAQYKGGKKHTQPAIDVLPASANYDINQKLTGPLKDSLDKTLHYLYDLAKMPGVSAAMLIPGRGLWQTDTGFASKPDLKRVSAPTVFYWASVGKLITATIIEQLIQEQKLKHQSKLSEWFPQLQDASKITIDELLTHTSGLYNFNNDTAKFSITRYYAPDELIKLSMSQKNSFPPGQYWSYSNTNYLLLALIAEKIEGKTYAEIVQQRIARPLHLTSLKALGPKEHPANLALAHANGNIVVEDYSVPLGAGNIISNARDMVILLYSLMSGILGPGTGVYDRLKDLYPMFDKGTWYGRGMMIFDFNEITKTNDLWIGHSGGTETYRAVLIYDTETKSFVAISINQHISVEAVAIKLLAQVKTTNTK